MFLRSLILRGFKTFADQTEIDFSEGSRITAIVGPNGCGKSNLMDATRWVIGEDNPRELRVAGLSDIIFAGTAARKALSLAEVSMIFDNSAGRLPVPFTEVAIKRRTFRESESEFFINKNQCRLKDIKDLLLDTGLGEATYSIITQGQVDAILSSKGDERRAVFEEAAGINKYKTRKHSAEKKLIAAEQNILRISDLKIEVAEHLITLEQQARSAREYLDIQQRVRDLDLGLSKRQIMAILEKKEQLARELDQLRQATQVKQAAEAQGQQELDALKSSLRELERELDETLLRLDEEKDRLRDLELDRRFTEGELKREQQALTDLAARDRELGGKIAELEQKLAREQSGLELGDAPLAAEFTPLIELTKSLVAQLSALLELFGKEHALTVTLGFSAEKEEAFRMKLEMLAEERQRLTGETERLEFAAQAHRAQLENLRGRNEEAGGKQASLDLLAAKRRQKDELAGRIDQLEQRLRQEDQAERQALTAESGLEIALAKLEGELTGISDRLSLEYNLTLAELSETAHEVENAAAAKREIEQGRSRLRALEPVNLLAIEEYEREKERLSFIEAQLADLNSARDHLRLLITELDQKAEQTFLETMEKLSAVFSETFAKLFSGGEARISLAGGVPALEAEIEISVRPNGRKWLPLPLLSGGERSLSAIAILFSLLKIRPSPFVFLDEVDAALDDANIGRFAGMLQDFAARSQIIVITHNKRTMEVADNIYGVTMEEFGVSKVISMRLAEAAV